MEMTTRALKVMEEEPPGRHELKAQFVGLRARGLSYAKIAKKLKWPRLPIYKRRWVMFKRKNSFLAIFLVIAFLATSIALALDYKYVGSKKSNKYHYPTCRYAQKIKPNNLVTFKSAQEAKAAGYAPCKVCKPPVTD
jgi:hypothetical protein